jgi:hypothetical protein
VIGGLITSTLLSLVVVPVVFTYVHKIKVWTKRAMAPKPLPPVQPAPPVQPVPTGHIPEPHSTWAGEPAPIRQRSAR